MESGISPATLSDFYEINRIQQEAFSTPWSTDLIRAAIVNSRYDVRVLRGESSPVMGFYISHCARGKSNLDNLAVETVLRGRGFGTQLIHDWMARAHRMGMTALSLQVNTSNVRAQKLYEEFDFKNLKLLVGYYPNGDDAYQMEMPFAAAAQAL
jgi:ribosomal-protein-alanine N-acetyltransferase